MASTSDRGEYYDISLADGGCDDNQPLSACYVFDLINNARHLRDESTQYRVNWQGGNYNTQVTSDWRDWIEVNGTSISYQHVLTHIFPWQLTPKEAGPRTPVLRILGSAKTTNVTFFIASYMMPYKHSVSQAGDTRLYNDGYAWEWTGNVAAQHPTVTSIIAAAGDDKTNDKQFYWDATANAVAEFNSWDLDVNNASQMYKVGVYLYRLTVYTKGDGYLYGISLREYAE